MAYLVMDIVIVNCIYIVFIATVFTLLSCYVIWFYVSVQLWFLSHFYAICLLIIVVLYGIM